MTFQHESSNNRCCQSYKYIGSSSTMQYHISCHTADNQLSTRQPSDADLSLGCPLNLAVTNVTLMFIGVRVSWWIRVLAAWVHEGTNKKNGN